MMRRMTWWLAQRGIGWHGQNLNARRGGGHGPMWQSGRCWLRWDGRGVLRVEWKIPSSFLHVCFEVGGDLGEDDYSVSLATPLAAIWVTLADLRRQPRRRNDREISVKWHHGTLWIYLWSDTNEWRSTDPWWQRITIRPADLLLGKQRYSTVTLSDEQVSVAMPEATYQASVRIFESTWYRPRWPWPRRMVRADIDVAGDGIPIPGKGENSYDLGDDAIYGLTVPAGTVPEAIGRLVASVLESRRRHGGRDWQPQAVAGAGEGGGHG